MALELKGLPRVFTFKHNNRNLTLDDPDPSMSPDEVMSFLSNQYSQLTTASVGEVEIKNDKAEYTFTTTLGTKG